MKKLLQRCRVAINAVSAVAKEGNEEEHPSGYTLHLEQTAFAGLIEVSKEEGHCLFRSYAPLRGRHQALVEAAVAANADLVSGSFAREWSDPDEQTIELETYIHHPEELNPAAFIARLRRNRDLFAFCLPLLEAVAAGELEPHDFNRQLRDATRRRPLQEPRAPEREEVFSDAQFDTHVSFSRGREAHCRIVSPLGGLAIPHARVTPIAAFCLDAQLRLGQFGSFAWPELGEDDEPLQFQTICWGPANTQRERVSLFVARHREALAACLPLLEALASETLEQAQAEAALLALARERHWV